MNTNVYTVMFSCDQRDYGTLIGVVVGDPNTWIESYLKGRPQFVMTKVEGKKLWKGYFIDEPTKTYTLGATEQNYTKTLGYGVTIEKSQDAFVYL